MSNGSLKTFLIAMVMTMAVTLAGCGGGGSSSGNGDNNGSPSTGDSGNGGPGGSGDSDGSGDGSGGDPGDGSGGGDNGDGSEDDTATTFDGPLDPVKNLSALLLEDVVVGELLPILVEDETLRGQLGDSVTCLSSGLNALLGASDTAVASFLGDFDSGMTPGLDTAAADAGIHLDLAINRIADGLLLALGGTGTCGDDVALEGDVDTEIAGLDVVLALARSNAFTGVTGNTELQALLAELSAATADLRQQLAGNEDVQPLYRNLVAVLDRAVQNTGGVFDAVFGMDFIPVQEAAGGLLEDLLSGLLTEVLPLGGLVDDGLLDGSALAELETLLDGITQALLSGDPANLLGQMEAAVGGIVDGLLGAGAGGLLEGELLDDLLGNLLDLESGPLGTLLAGLLDAASNDSESGLLGQLVNSLLGNDGLLGGLLGGDDDGGLLGGLL